MHAPRCRRLAVLIAALVAVVGVSASTPAPGLPPRRRQTSEIAGPGRVVRLRAPPCPRPHRRTGPSGDVVQSLRVGGLTRSYRLAVPARYRSTRPTPLILLFHGSGPMPSRPRSTPRCPAGPPGPATWWPHPTASAAGGSSRPRTAPPPTWPIVRRPHRTAVVRATAWTGRRIYAAGISLGSEFAAIVGCTPADHIAAVGPGGGGVPPAAVPVPLPVIAFHGTADPIVPYRSGGTGAVPARGAGARGGAEPRLLGPARPMRRPPPDPSGCRAWWSGGPGPGAADGSAVVLYTVLGGGHTWPGSPVTLSAGTFGATTQQIDATGLMLASSAGTDSAGDPGAREPAAPGGLVTDPAYRSIV